MVDSNAGSLKCTAGHPATDTAGPSITCGPVEWTILAQWGEGEAKVVVVEHSFNRWGMTAFVSTASASPKYPVVLRKPIGQLETLSQPVYNLTQGFWDKATNSLHDYPLELAAARTADGEPDYPSIAAQLAPQRDTAEISHAADVNKFVVSFAGRVKCASSSKLGEVGTSRTAYTASFIKNDLIVKGFLYCARHAW